MEFKICHNEVKYSTCLRSANAKKTAHRFAEIVDDKIEEDLDLQI